MNELQAIAADYANNHSLTVIPALGKVPALDNVKTWEMSPPSEREREAMFAESGLNIAFLCGAASNNLFQIDAETERAFDQQYELCHRAGITNTWIVRTPSGGGHLLYRLPFPVKTRGKVRDVEVLAQGRISIAPPSVAVSKLDGSPQPYVFANKTAQIMTLDAVEQVQWLGLEKASLHVPLRALPRKAKRLLDGDIPHGKYETRSECEHAIVTVMVNAGFPWDEILSAFRRYPAAGKFASLSHGDPHVAVEWLRTSYNEARVWAASVSPVRQNALALLNYAQCIPWPGRSGSSLRACFVGHCILSYRSGAPSYHGSVRDIAELSGCDKGTASRATDKLCRAGALNLVQKSAFTFARRFKLPLFSDLDAAVKFNGKVIHKREKEAKREKLVCVSKSNSLNPQPDTQPLPETGKRRKCVHSLKPNCEGVLQVSSFLLPEAFRPRGLGRSAYEVLCQLSAGPLQAKHLAERTGRDVQTVRKALKRLKQHGLTAKSAGKCWIGRAIEDIDLDELARSVCMKGSARGQKERHKADRLRFSIRHRVRQHEQSEQGDT